MKRKRGNRGARRDDRWAVWDWRDDSISVVAIKPHCRQIDAGVAFNPIRALRVGADFDASNKRFDVSTRRFVDNEDRIAARWHRFVLAGAVRSENLLRLSLGLATDEERAAVIAALQWERSQRA